MVCCSIRTTATGVPVASANAHLDLGAEAHAVNNGVAHGTAIDSVAFVEDDNLLGQQPDYSMIGDMLDVTGDLDWEMWGKHIDG